MRGRRVVLLPRPHLSARVLLALLAALSPLLVAAGPAYADHGGPSATAVAQAKAHAARLEQQVAAAAAGVARAQDALDALRTQAEIAAEAFNRATVQQQVAARAADAAKLVLDAAAARVGGARAEVSRFAVAAYEGGTMSSVDVVLTSRGPDAMLYRIGALDQVSKSQRDVLQGLHAAEVYQGVVQKQAAEALVAAQRATAVADRARLHAQQLVETQTAAVARVTAAQHRLATMLTQARAHASALERARLAAIARARAEAAARRAAALQAQRLREEQAAQAAQAQQAAEAPQGAQQSGGGQTGSGGGATVSAGTEAAALRHAESQVGKPYQWGAAGPDTYDCSGLVMWSYAQVGVHVDHWTGYQWNEGEHIPLSSLRAGDLLFFATDTSNPDTIHHVGMYVGNGVMVEAPYTGADVRYSNAFRPDLIGAVRFYNR